MTLATAVAKSFLPSSSSASVLIGLSDENACSLSPESDELLMSSFIEKEGTSWRWARPALRDSGAECPVDYEFMRGIQRWLRAYREYSQKRKGCGLGRDLTLKHCAPGMSHLRLASYTPFWQALGFRRSSQPVAAEPKVWALAMRQDATTYTLPKVIRVPDYRKRRMSAHSGWLG
jgi:hypothetical protein